MPSRQHWYFVVSAIFVLAMSSLARSDEPTRRALLVGVGKYEHLIANYHLPGPPNDVALFEQTLQSRLGVAPANIRVLTDNRGEENLPRRAAIIAAVEHLIDESDRGDQVLLLLAGHGSRQPDQDGDERDGWDEVFLPSDISKWERGPVVIPGAITDDEIDGWLQAFDAKGVFVLFIADSCHSGTLSRAVGEPRTREVAASKLLPKETTEAETARSPAVPPTPRGRLDREQRQRRQNVVSLYAVSALEKEEEREFHGKPYGLLSYAVCHVLAQDHESLTYRELDQRARWFMQGMSEPWFKGPVLEGAQIDREVLGMQTWLGRSAITLQAAVAGQLRVDVGLLHGLTDGSVLSVFSPGGADDRPPEGHVRVTDALPWEATVVPCEFGDEPPRSLDELPTPGICRIEYIDYGSLRLRVGVAGLNRDPLATNLADRTVFPQQQQQLLQAVRSLAKERDSLVELVEEGDQAEWWLLVDKQHAYLRQAGSDAGLAARENKLFGPYPLANQLRDSIRDVLRQVAKVTNLRRLAAAGENIVTRSAAANVVVTIGQKDAESEEVTQITKYRSLRWRDGDSPILKLENRGRLPVDVTVLYIDSSLGIMALWPVAAGDTKRLFPGENAEPLLVDITINDGTLGFEDVIVIAQVANPNHQGSISFAGIAQPRLSRVRGDTPTPLQRLLEKAAFGAQTRDGRRPRVASYSIQRLTWEVVTSCPSSGD